MTVFKFHPGRKQHQDNEIMALMRLRVKTFELLMWLAYRIGLKNNFHLLQCPLCTAQFFMIDGYLYCYLNSAAKSVSAAFKLDLEMSDAVVTCRHCGEEIEVKDAAIELLNLISQSGAQWMRLRSCSLNQINGGKI